MDPWLADRIGERTGPISSHPTRPVWGLPLEESGDTIRTRSIFDPRDDGPPEHYHEQSTESFDVKLQPAFWRATSTSPTVIRLRFARA